MLYWWCSCACWMFLLIVAEWALRVLLFCSRAPQLFFCKELVHNIIDYYVVTLISYDLYTWIISRMARKKLRRGKSSIQKSHCCYFTAHHDHILLHTLSLKYRTSFAKSKTRHIDTIISQNKSNNLASVTKSLEI